LANAVGFVERERMERWLFSNQKEMSADTIKAALLDISGVGAETFDARYDSVIAQVKEDIALGATLPVEATPTFVINGVMLKGGLNAQYFDQAIDYELARAEESL
jgi:protein-disulfide isomerase